MGNKGEGGEAIAHRFREYEGNVGPVGLRKNIDWRNGYLLMSGKKFPFPKFFFLGVPLHNLSVDWIILELYW